MSWLPLILVLVVLQRIGELMLARRNTARLLARGGREVGRRHYPLLVLLHAAWLLALATMVPLEREPNWALIGGFAMLQGARLWVIRSLGPYWTTRIITLPDRPLVRTGPYRYLKHPNYLVVVAEIAVLPLAFGAWEIALLASIANAALLAWRIRIEEAALAERRAIAASVDILEGL